MPKHYARRSRWHERLSRRVRNLAVAETRWLKLTSEPRLGQKRPRRWPWPVVAVVLAVVALELVAAVR